MSSTEQTIQNGFCPDCDGKYNGRRGLAQHYRHSHDGSLPPRTVTITCNYCSETKEKLYENVGDGEYCSRECHFKDENLKRKNEASETRPCSNCGKAITRPRSLFEHNESEFWSCGEECRVELYGEMFTGEDNHNWKGGIASSLRLELYNLGTDSWNRQRRRVREEQNGKCAQCDEIPNRNLEVHHIIPAVSGGVSDSDLLMGLCSTCHGEIESYTRNFTENHMLSDEFFG